MGLLEFAAWGIVQQLTTSETSAAKRHNVRKIHIVA